MRQIHQFTDEDSLTYQTVQPGRKAAYAEFPKMLHPALKEALRSAGIEQLYEHQKDAFFAAQQGSFITVAGTASGKSLAFHLPILQDLHQNTKSCALYLYPTKALAQDQARSLHELRLSKLIRPAIYDGDTEREQRQYIRKSANMLFTNPDMLHVGILPHHYRWTHLFANLVAVVIDEAHVYRGVFGSHVANTIRRLRRVANVHGSDPHFFLASATIANPRELAQKLTGIKEITLIEARGAPERERTVVMWNPPVLDEKLGTRKSPLSEAAKLLTTFMSNNQRVICFVKSRRSVELITREVKDRLHTAAPQLASKITSYRAGYTAMQRRSIENRLRSKELLAVVTTDALELGIDIGHLEVSICVTFPGTVASLKQMWGRAGRRNHGVGVYIAGEDALDQFFCQYPEEFLQRPVEQAILDENNKHILQSHLQCAAHELSLTTDNMSSFSAAWQSYAKQLTEQQVLVQRNGHYALSAMDRYPAGEISLRSASPGQVTIIELPSGELLGTTEYERSFDSVHAGAIYLHSGRSFEVVKLDLDQRQALVQPFFGDWYTQPKHETMTTISQELSTKTLLGVELSFGVVQVTDQVLGYQRKQLPGHNPIDLIPLDLPVVEFVTQAMWFTVPDNYLETISEHKVLLGTLHAVEHAQIAVLPLLAMCDRWDIGGLSTNLHPQTGKPTIFIYEGHPGGIGIAQKAFTAFVELCQAAHQLMTTCRCQTGCPSCVQSPKCGNLNDPLHKGGAIALLHQMLQCETLT